MKHKWLRRVSWILLTPVALFLLVMILLYIPPIQSFLRKQATSYASEATGMQIEVGSIHLRFPLNLAISDVTVAQPCPADSLLTGSLLTDTVSTQKADTLLSLEKLNVKVQFWPLLKGKIEVDNVTLQNIALNTADMLEGMQVKGILGKFYLESHGIDLPEETAIINRALLSDTHVDLILTDTTTVEDTATTAPLNWDVALEKLQLDNIGFNLIMPHDSATLTTRLKKLDLSKVKASLGTQEYVLNSIRMDGGKVGYQQGYQQALPGLDPSHILLRNLHLELDSVQYSKHKLMAMLKDFGADERSGLSISSLKARIISDEKNVQIPQLQLLTPHSEISLSGLSNWALVDTLTNGHLSARLNARIGKQDVLLATNLPDTFHHAYPDHPILIKAGTEGNLTSMQLSGFQITLPGAFDLKGTGDILHITDSVRREANFDLTLGTGNLDFLTTLAGMDSQSSLNIPDSMNLEAGVRLRGDQVNAQLTMQEQEGKILAEASYNLGTEAYKADINVHNFQVNHFLPQNTIYRVTLSAAASGKGIDFMQPTAKANATVKLEQLDYDKFHLSDIHLDAALQHSVASATFSSNNSLVDLTLTGQYNLAHTYPDGNIDLELRNIDLFQLGLIEKPFEQPVTMRLTGEVKQDKINANFNSGDLSFNFRSPEGVNEVMACSERFIHVLTRQLKNNTLDHKALREALPKGGFGLDAGQENAMAWYLEQQGVKYKDLSVRFGATPDWGINALAQVRTLQIDSLQLDTVKFIIDQDTARIRMRSVVANGPQNPQIEFTSTITAEIRTQDAELMLNYQNAKKETGLNFGINARPWINEQQKSNGIVLTIVPERPIIAYHPFEFEDKHNWAYIHKNMRVYANIFMENANGTALRMQSLSNDTVSLQNMDVELRKIPLEEVFAMFPYLPDISGMLTAEAHYIQTEKSLQLATEMEFEKLAYEKRPVGNIGVSATWLPGERNEQYVDAVLSHNSKEVVYANGMIQTSGKGDDRLDIELGADEFPLDIAKAFIPEDMLQLKGLFNSHFALGGSTSKPNIEGDLAFDSTSVYIPQADARFTMDNRKIKVKGNRLIFDKYAIYASGKSPFTITGDINMKNLSQPTANLKLAAKNYTLLDAKRQRNSLVYGKVFCDVNAAAKGPLDDLMVRGNINLLNSTNVTYVLKDSPLTVEDRLSELVTFTSFNDTTMNVQEQKKVSLGGLDAIMMIHVDPTVSIGVDLSADRNNRIKLVGGGDLSMQLTPQGDMSLTGRYTLSGGLLKFSPLPVIPTKEFAINKGSYVEWTGDIMDPKLKFKATDHVRTSVPIDDGSNRMIDFNVSVVVKNRLENLDLGFEIEAPEDAYMQNKLLSMGEEERTVQAIGMLATGFYLGESGNNNFNLSDKMGSALSSVVSSQINALAGNLKGASFQFGMEDHDASETGGKRTDYSFKYSQRFFNDRFQIVLGGKVSTGEDVSNEPASFIDNVSFEYRLDASGTRYVRLFYDKNYDSVFEGEITETGAGIVLRRRMNKLSELFTFRKKDKKEKKADKESGKKKENKKDKNKKDKKEE